MEVRIRQSYDDTHSVLKAAKNSTEQEIFFRSALYSAFQFKMSSMVFIIMMFSLMHYYHYHVFVTLEEWVLLQGVCHVYTVTQNRQTKH